MTDQAKPDVPLLVPSQPTTASISDEDRPYVLSYFAQRRAAGWVGLVLPPLVWIWDRYSQLACAPSSISASYYTGARNFFVGGLCAVGIFLVTSLGYRRDRPFSIAAGVLAFLVAFCPTDPDTSCRLAGSLAPFPQSPAVHQVAAISLFLIFAIFCLFLFTKSATPDGLKLPRQKEKRNRVFKICGTVMIVAMLAYPAWIAIHRLDNSFAIPHHLLLAVEWTCLWSFGFAWLVKGQQLFKDIDGDPADTTIATG